MARFISGFLGAVILIPLVTAAVNYTVDPYSVFGAPSIAGLNALKPALLSRERIYKNAIAHEPWDAVILGTSRAQVGLDPRFPGLGGTRVVNLATSSQPYQETLLLFLEAARGGRLRTAVLGLDFFAANSSRPYPPDFIEDDAERPSRLQLLFSISTAGDSTKTLLNQSEAAGLRDGWLMRADGMRLLGDEYVRARGGHRALASLSELRFLTEDYPPPAQFDLATPQAARSQLNCLAELVREAHRRDVRLLLFVSPAHARQWEVLDRAGLWQTWERWKAALVAINEEEAARAGRPAFPLRDFSGYSEFNTEGFPAAGDRQTRMRWFIESSHYRPALGDVVLRQLLDSSLATRRDGFGAPLTRSGLDSHLAQLRRDRDLWRSAHPIDAGEIAAAGNSARPIRASRNSTTMPAGGQGCAARTTRP